MKPVIKKCLNCEKDTRNYKFCSRKCSYAYNNKILGREYREIKESNYYKNPKICLICKNIISYEKRRNRFCGSSCFAKHNNTGVRRHGKFPGHCLVCGKKLRSSINKCCSHKCAVKREKDEFIKKWLGGEINGLRGKDRLSKFIRDYLFEKHNEKCQKCGWSKRNEWTNKVPLTVHHMDGNWRNNKQNNLELLCPNCHSLTKFYGIKNKGRGRESRQIWRDSISKKP